MNLWAESDNLELASRPLQQTKKPGTGVGTRFMASPNAIVPALRAWLLADYVAPYCRSMAATGIFRRCFWIDAPGGTRNAAKKAGESQAREEPHPYILDDLTQTAGHSERSEESHGPTSEILRCAQNDTGRRTDQLEHSSSHPNKAAKKARPETLPPALQSVVALADELARESKPITLQGIALDNGKVGKVENTFVLPKESGVVNSSWREAAPALLPAIEQFAAIFLLNPLAITKQSSSNLKVKEIPFLTIDELAPLVQRTAPTELCLWLRHRQVETAFLPALRTPAGASAFTALLRSDRWKALLAQESERAPRVDKAIDLWLASLQPHFLFVQRMAFPMLVGPATVEDAPCSLIFATRRQDSLGCMNDAVCSYRRRLEQESYRGILNEAWFAAQQAERDAQAMRELSEDTLRTGRARSPRRWSDLRQQLLLDRFGQWMLREYDEVICRLLKPDEVRCQWRQPNNNGEPCRVPGNDDMLQWQWKKRRY